MRKAKRTDGGPAITRAQLRSELDELLKRAGISPKTVKMTFSAVLDHQHKHNRRTYARLSLNKRHIEVARAILRLDAPHRLGILAHEVGHLYCDATIGRKHTEPQTDRCAKESTGVLISYDRSYGRHPIDKSISGLQVGTDLTVPHHLGRRRAASVIESEIEAATGRRITKRKKSKGRR